MISLDIFINNKTELLNMPFMNSKRLSSCKGDDLYCAYEINKKMSKDKYKVIIDALSKEEKRCYQPCTDTMYSMKTTSSAYPAQETFQYSKEACILLIKFFEECKIYNRFKFKRKVQI